MLCLLESAVVIDTVASAGSSTIEGCIRHIIYLAANIIYSMGAKCRQTSTATVSQPVSNENVFAKLRGLFVE